MHKRFFFYHGKAAVQQVLEDNIGEFKFEFSGFDFWKIQYVINEIEKMLAAGQDIRQIFILKIINLPKMLIHNQFCKTDDVV